jgi:4-hydroxy-tetrahydrodipicolinate reductase
MPLKVIQWATGAVGSLALSEIIRNPELELVGVYVYTDAKHGKDAGELVGLDPVGVTATNDRDAILALDADAVIHSPLAPSMEEMDDDVVALLESGKNVLSTAGYFAPEFRGPELVSRLEAACAAGGTSIHGGGIEPGFMFDRMAPTLTGMCTDIDHIRLYETIDAADHPAGEMILTALSMGKPLDEVSIDSPFSQYFVAMFSEVATAFGLAIGVTFDRLEPSLDLAPATHDFDIAVGHIAKNTIAGNRYTIRGFLGDQELLRLEVHWLVERDVLGWPTPTHRYLWGVDIEGRPSSRTVIDVVPTLGDSGADYDPGFYATAATAVLAIPGLCAAPPGIFHPPVFGTWTPLKEKAHG